MPFHLLASRWFSLYTGGLGQWDAAKDILTLMALGFAILIVIQQKLFQNRLVLALFGLMALYGGLHVLLWFTDRENQDFRSAVVATLYNGRIFAYAFIGLVVGALHLASKQTVLKILLIASTITCLFAFVQYVGPDNLMSHFGYSVERGAKPSFFIDDKPDFPRVFSSIRDPNSYGAYLIVPITFLWGAVLKLKAWRKKALLLLGIHLLALLLTFSRGAWLGAIIALSIASFLLYERKVFSFIKKQKWLIAAALVLIVPIMFAVKNSYVFQNVFLHSDKSTVMADPNEIRLSLLQEVTEDVVEEPQGHGPGTAGLVSIGNPKGTRLTENYFLQIGYEVGWLGLAIFVGLVALSYYLLIKAPREYITISLLASFWAYLFIATLIHLWSNEAVAAQWWLLAGWLIGQGTLVKVSPRSARTKKSQP